MKKTIAVRFAVALGVSLLAACGDPDPSSSIPTDQIYARYTAETDGDGMTHFRAEYLQDEDFLLYEGVYLDGGDSVTFSGADQSLSLPGGGSVYDADLLTGVTENTRFQFDLECPSFQDAPDSYGTLPAPMDLVTPKSGEEYSISQDNLAVAWTWPGTIDDMSLHVAADCLDPNTEQDRWLDESFTVDVPGDPGAYTINLSDELVHEDQCRRYAATVTLYRARAGTVDRALAPNEDRCENDDSYPCKHLEYVSVRQVRSVDVVLTP